MRKQGDKIWEVKGLFVLANVMRNIIGLAPLNQIIDLPPV